MRKVILIFMIMCISTSMYCQTTQDTNKKTEPQSITGFGKLQLGMKISDIPELIDAKKITSMNDYFAKVYGNRTKKSYEIVNDTNEKYPQGEYDKRVREFQIGEYDLTDNIKVTNVNIKFFNDSLYYIEIKDTKMKELLKTKYGDGILDVKEKENTFQNGYGATFVKTDQTFTINWIVDNPYVSCNFVLMRYYNENGELRVLYYSILSNKLYIDKVEIESKIVKDRISNREKDKKKEDIKGF